MIKKHVNQKKKPLMPKGMWVECPDATKWGYGDGGVEGIVRWSPHAEIKMKREREGKRERGKKYYRLRNMARRMINGMYVKKEIRDMMRHRNRHDFASATGRPYISIFPKKKIQSHWRTMFDLRVIDDDGFFCIRTAYRPRLWYSPKTCHPPKGEKDEPQEEQPGLYWTSFFFIIHILKC
jgi:hypothetical protein